MILNMDRDSWCCRKPGWRQELPLGSMSLSDSMYAKHRSQLQMGLQ